MFSLSSIFDVIIYSYSYSYLNSGKGRRDFFFTLLAECAKTPLIRYFPRTHTHSHTHTHTHTLWKFSILERFFLPHFRVGDVKGDLADFFPVNAPVRKKCNDLLGPRFVHSHFSLSHSHFSCSFIFFSCSKTSFRQTLECSWVPSVGDSSSFTCYRT